MTSHAGADGFAEAAHEIDHTGRNAGLFTSLHQVISRKWCIFGRLDDDCVAAH